MINCHNNYAEYLEFKCIMSFEKLSDLRLHILTLQQKVNSHKLFISILAGLMHRAVFSHL